ncbi:MAG: hypothetical protein AAGI07_03035 [Bacteroidota bacterium]
MSKSIIYITPSFRLIALRFVLIFFSTLFCSSLAFSQKNCLQELEKDENLYAEGKLKDIPLILSQCIKKGFDKEQKTRAYELIILSYLYLDNELLAAENMLALLRFEKEYDLTGREPAEFKKLYNSFRTYPIFMIGVNLGGNFSFASPGELYGVGILSKDSINYNTNLGIKIGISSDFQIGKHILLSQEINIQNINYTYSNRLFDFTQYEFRESQTILSLPIGMKILAGGKKFLPFISMGIGFDILLRSNLQITRTFPERPIVDVTGQDVDITNLRNQNNYHFYFGTGFKWKVPRSFFFFEARFASSRLNQVNVNRRYSNTELIYRYGHIDNDFLLNHLNFSVGLQYNFYKPKLLRKYFYN